ncbi:MAG: dTMP kinase [Archaeoglobales archaeon]|nr:dTMP kinase [Archaeoglobales archaeon]
MLIAIEGIDGAGKTTIANFLAEELRKMGYDVVVFKEPSNSVYGKKIKFADKRLSLEEEMDLFLKDRIEDVKNNIIPALKDGKIVIMDRYYYSNAAYQSARGRLNALDILKMNEKIAPKPDLVLLLDLDVEVALKRLESRGKLSVFEDKEYLRKVRDVFLEIADERTVVVDASKPLDALKKEVLKIVKSFLQAAPL